MKDFSADFYWGQSFLKSTFVIKALWLQTKEKEYFICGRRDKEFFFLSLGQIYKILKHVISGTSLRIAAYSHLWVIDISQRKGIFVDFDRTISRVSFKFAGK